jgi:hypothetical protein
VRNFSYILNGNSGKLGMVAYYHNSFDLSPGERKRLKQINVYPTQLHTASNSLSAYHLIIMKKFTIVKILSLFEVQPFPSKT